MYRKQYNFSQLSLKQKFVLTFSLILIISLTIALFGVVLSILYYLVAFFIALFIAIFIYTKITSFFKQSKQDTDHPAQKSEDIIINAEAISVEIKDKND